MIPRAVLALACLAVAATGLAAPRPPERVVHHLGEVLGKGAEREVVELPRQPAEAGHLGNPMHRPGFEAHLPPHQAHHPVEPPVPEAHLPA